MAPAAALAQHESVSKKRPDNLAGSERPNLGKVDRHECESHGDCDSGAFEHLNIIVRRGWKGNAVLSKLVDDHLDDFIDVGERFLMGRALRHRAELAQSGAIGMKPALIWLYHYFECVGLHS
jgi:hypothetical protein